MKKYTLFITLFLLIPIPGTAQERKAVSTVESSVKEVTVFRDGAQITRKATVMLDAGPNEIVFGGLAPSLQPETIQLTGTGSFTILSISHQKDYLGEYPQKKRLQRLKNRRDSLETLIGNKETAMSILKKELNILLSNTEIKGKQQNLSVTELDKAMKFFHRELTDLENRQLKLKRDLANLRKELEKVKRQIAELNGDVLQKRSVITANLQSEQSSRVTLTATYLVSRAGWHPSYDIRVNDIDGPVNLSYKANIEQNTRTDWNNVSLEVSSASPDRGGDLPEMSPWYVRFYRAKPEVRTAANMTFKEGISQAKAAADRKEKQQKHHVQVQEIQRQTSFSYRIERPYDVPSGGKPLTVEVKNVDIPAQYRYYTVPRLREQAYLTARIGEWDQYNLLPGQASLFFGKTYVGQSTINPRTINDTLSFSLGQDHAIVVERKKLDEFEEKNFFGSKIRQTFAWEISIRNTKEQPINIKVLDQIPISQNEAINVSLKESSGADYNRTNGFLTWKLQIKPGETKTRRFVYEVEYPEGKRIDL